MDESIETMGTQLKETTEEVLRQAEVHEALVVRVAGVKQVVVETRQLHAQAVEGVREETAVAAEQHAQLTDTSTSQEEEIKQLKTELDLHAAAHAETVEAMAAVQATLQFQDETAQRLGKSIHQATGQLSIAQYHTSEAHAAAMKVQREKEAKQERHKEEMRGLNAAIELQQSRAVVLAEQLHMLVQKEEDERVVSVAMRGAYMLRRRAAASQLTAPELLAQEAALAENREEEERLLTENKELFKQAKLHQLNAEKLERQTTEMLSKEPKRRARIAAAAERVNQMESQLRSVMAHNTAMEAERSALKLQVEEMLAEQAKLSERAVSENKHVSALQARATELRTLLAKMAERPQCVFALTQTPTYERDGSVQTPVWLMYTMQ